MDRLGGHLESISLPLILVAALAAVFLFHLIPRRFRFQFSLAFLVVILTISRLPYLGAISSLCKIASFAFFLLIAYCAARHPGGRCRLPVIAWGYLYLSIVAIVYVMGTADRNFAVAIRIQWVFLILAAILACRTVVNENSLRHIFWGLFVGQVISCLITFSSAIVYPASLRGTYVAGRFTPYDCNPNQIGLLFAVTAALGLYFLVSSRGAFVRGLALAGVALALAQIVLSVSRTAAIVFVIMSLPSLFVVLRKQPIVAVLCAMTFALGIYLALGYAEDIDFWHVEKGLDRTGLWAHGMETFMEHPYLGMFNSNEAFAVDPEEDPHNAYVRFLTMGGITLSLPLFLFQFCGYFFAARIWIFRKSLPVDPLLTSVVAAMVVAIFAQGFANNIIYYPTFTWAFLNIFLSCVTIILFRLRDGEEEPAGSYAPLKEPLGAIAGP